MVGLGNPWNLRVSSRGSKTHGSSDSTLQRQMTTGKSRQKKKAGKDP